MNIKLNLSRVFLIVLLFFTDRTKCDMFTNPVGLFELFKADDKVQFSPILYKQHFHKKWFCIAFRGHLKKAFDSNGITYPAALLVMIGEGTFFWLNTHLDDVTSLKDDHPEGSCINDVYQFWALFRPQHHAFQALVLFRHKIRDPLSPKLCLY